MKDVAIIDYKMSNLHSVEAACRKVGLSCLTTNNHDKIMNSKAAILPGVGAFGPAISFLKKSGLDCCIKDFVETGKPFIGICLGMQLLFESSEEFGHHKGLGLVKGKVKKFQFQKLRNLKYPIPQVGWNKIKKENLDWKGTLLENNNNGDFLYFVHSHYVEPKESKIILSTTTYNNKKYCSSINDKNIFATQFHPEKSGLVGIAIYEKLKNNMR